MADLSDVLTALKALLVGAVYPGQQAAGQSSVGFDVVVGVGWPDDTELQAALDVGRAFVSIYPLSGERNATTWEFTDQEIPRNAPGIAIVFSDEDYIATVSGVAQLGDVIGIETTNGSYTVTPTVGMSAVDVCALIASTLPTGAAHANASDLIVTFQPHVAFIVSNNGLMLQNIGTLERRVQITAWSYDQASRDKLMSLLTVTVQQHRFLNVKMMADEVVGMRYDTSNWSDKPQNAGGYMRSLIVLVNFQTTVYTPAYAVLHPRQDITGVY